MLQPGSVLGGKYRLIDRLGEGGMGSVWVAENSSIRGSEVALKVLHAHFSSDHEAVRRFRQEAEAAFRIGHPNIVKVFDYGVSDDGSPYLVMERLQGESLAERLTREEKLPPNDAVDVVVKVLYALEAAHEKDILHRDLKPENIFLARGGETIEPKILDFGVSKFLGDDAERVKMTRTGALIGTPAYMAPEQAMGLATVDLRADVWAMGVILYELITGTLPYDGPTYNAVLVRIATEDPTPMPEQDPPLDPGLIAVTLRALARNPRERFASARVMREALERWRRGEATEVTAPARMSQMPQARQTPLEFERSDTMLDTHPRGPRRGSPAVLLAGAIALTAVATVALTLRVGRATNTPVVTALHRPAAHQLRIDGLPRGAHITVDGSSVMLPTRVSSDGVHSVRVDAEGYRRWDATVARPSGDITLRFEGAQLPPTPTPPSVPATVAVRPARRLPVRPGAPTAPAIRGGPRHVNELLARDPNL